MGVYFFCVDSHLVECVGFNLVSVYKLVYKCSLLPCMFLVVIIKSSLSRSARGVAGHSDRVNHVKHLCYFTFAFLDLLLVPVVTSASCY